MVQVAEVSPENTKAKIRPKSQDVDLIEVSLPGAEIFIQGRSNYGKVSTFFLFC